MHLTRSVLAFGVAVTLQACSCNDDDKADDTDTDTSDGRETDVVETDTDPVDTDTDTDGVVDTDPVETDTDVDTDTDTDLVVIDTFQPPLDCLTFTEAAWGYFGHRVEQGTPAATDGDTVTLTEDGVNRVAGAVISTAEMSVPYRIAFEYQTVDDDGTVAGVFDSADGLVLMVLKDASAYDTDTVLPAADARGFLADGTGYGVHLQTFQPRELQIKDGTRAELASISEGGTFTVGAWVPVVVTVRTGRIDVDFANGINTLSYDAPADLDVTHLGWGFAAATGGEDSAHRVRNVCVGAAP